MNVSERLKNTAILGALPLLLLVVGLGCSTDSPTAPTQQPIPPGSGAPSAAWSISISIDEPELFANGGPATVTVRVRQAGTGTPPPNGTTIVISTSLGEFGSFGSGLSSAALSTVNGLASVLLYPGVTAGTAILTAQLEESAAQISVPILDELPPLAAAFSTENTTDNFSVQFVNTSTGNPDRYLWDFGDGATSNEKHPFHIYATSGDFVVELTVFRGEEFDKAIQAIRIIEDIFITAYSPRSGPIGTTITIDGVGFDIPVRVFLGGILMEVISVTSTRIVARVPSDVEFETEPCDLAGEEPGSGGGVIEIPTAMSLTVEVKGVSTDTIADAFLVQPAAPTCVEDPTAGGGDDGGGGVV